MINIIKDIETFLKRILKDNMQSQKDNNKNSLENKAGTGESSAAITNYHGVFNHEAYRVTADASGNITTAIYMISDFLENTDPLKATIRSTAVGIMDSLYRALHLDKKERAEILAKAYNDYYALISYLKVIQKNGFVSEMNYKVISREIEKERTRIHAHLERSLPYDKKRSRTRAVESFSFASDFFDDTRENNTSRSQGTRSDSPAPKPVSQQKSQKSVKDSKESHEDSLKTNESTSSEEEKPVFVERNPNRALDNYRARKNAGKKGVKQKAKRKPKLNEAKIERKENIIKILKQKSDASINDITALTKNYSLKTIQRDLKELIKDNLVKKEGSRRWSTYNLTF